MLGIVDVGTYIPAGRIDTMSLREKFDFAESFIKDKVGFTSLSRKGPDEETSDLAVAAVKALVAKTGLDLASLQVVVLVTQNGDGKGLPHTSAIVHKKLGLPTTCFAFDVSLGCSGYVAGLAVIKGFMETAGLTRGVLVTADPYSKIVDPDDRNTALLFGDAATATLIADNPRWRIGAFDFGTIGSQCEALEVKPDGKLFMNGRGVFDFSATHVPPSIGRALERNKCSPTDVDGYLLHQGSKFIVDTIGKRLKATNVVTGAESYGNAVSSSVPLLLEKVWGEPHRRLVLSGFGVGVGWATTVIERVTQQA